MPPNGQSRVWRITHPHSDTCSFRPASHAALALASQALGLPSRPGAYPNFSDPGLMALDRAYARELSMLLPASCWDDSGSYNIATISRVLGQLSSLQGAQRMAIGKWAGHFSVTPLSDLVVDFTLSWGFQSLVSQKATQTPQTPARPLQKSDSHQEFPHAFGSQGPAFATAPSLASASFCIFCKTC